MAPTRGESAPAGAAQGAIAVMVRPMTTTADRGYPGTVMSSSNSSRLMTVTAAVACVLTAAVVAVPFVAFAYRAPQLHVMLETINAVVASLVAYLVYGRFRQQRRLQALLITLALATVAVANLVLTALPDALGLDRVEDLNHWTPLVLRLLGTIVLATAALTPADVRVGHRSTVGITLALTGLMTAIGVAGLLWSSSLPAVVGPLVDVDVDGSSPLLVAHPAVLGAHSVGLLVYGAAAVAITRQAARTQDELLRWVGAGCVLAAFSRVHYLLFPSLYSDYVYTGDLLRLGFYAFMLVGAAREITSFWQARAESAVLEDRRRIARDLHDGLIQELAYIYAQSQRLEAHPGDAVAVQRIGGAAGRAIDESRRALAALTSPGQADFPVALQQSVDEMASRYDVKIVTAIDGDTQTDGPMADALLRVTGEAVRNAVRHGRANRIEVRLTAEPLSLTVTDDGCGFAATAPEARRPGAFGLTSMSERAAGVGATLSVESAPGEGTTVRVSWT